MPMMSRRGVVGLILSGTTVIISFIVSIPSPGGGTQLQKYVPPELFFVFSVTDSGTAAVVAYVMDV
jgi:hypothetical protein